MKFDLVSKKKPSMVTESIAIIDIKKCTGCSGCMNICPKGAISMYTDETGFLVPRIYEEKCDACGLCKSICPVLGTKSFFKENSLYYTIVEWNDNDASENVISILAKEILKKDGVVCGAFYTDEYGTYQQVITAREKLRTLIFPLYVESKVELTYFETKRLLEEGKIVLYIGLPCQIEGLLYYLRKKYKNLITIDILCQGITSDKLFKKFLEDNYKDLEIRKNSYEDKRLQGKGIVTSYELSNGHVERLNLHNNVWLAAYFENVINRSCCYECKYRAISRIGDISIGELKENKDSRSKKIIFVNSKQGKELLNYIKSSCKLEEITLHNFSWKCNYALYIDEQAKRRREIFFEAIKKMPVPAALDRAIYGEKYKVGIVGWWYNLNYGGTLTYYALNYAVKKLGYSVLMVKRSSNIDTIPNENTVPMKFAKKHYNCSRYYTARELHWINYSCHAFISGSDQLWNPYLEAYTGSEFFLSFVNRHNLKLSYASSFGNVDTLLQNYVDKYKPFLKRFNGISVREDYAVDLCKQYLDVDAVQVCDPIFLCDIEEYKKIGEKSKLKFSERFLLNFLLDPDEEKIKACRFVQKKLGIENYENFTDLQNVEEKERNFQGENVHINAEIEDFVKAYSCAEFVITDSFHGTCLAVIFNKPFISIGNHERGIKRFISLLKWLGLKERLVFAPAEINLRLELLESIDFTEVNRVIEESQKKGYEWLYGKLKEMV